MPKIAVFANDGSPQAAEIAIAISEQGGEPLVFDIRVGGDTMPAVSFGSEGASWGGVSFDDIRAVHIRCTAPRTLPVLPPLLNAVSYAEYRLAYLREQAFNAATQAFFEHLAARGALVVNRLTTAYIDHDSKGQLYEKLRAAGFCVPRSLSTTSPQAAARFIDEVGDAVMKPAIGVGSTRVVTPSDRNRFGELARCPALFQERIPGNTLRIHIVGDRVVLALRIIAEGVDSRTGKQEFEPIELPAEEAAAIVRANRFMGLHYAAWDAIEGADGRLRYLDCNPGPFVMWLADEHRKLVFAALARYLIAFADKGTVEAALAAA